MGLFSKGGKRRASRSTRRAQATDSGSYTYTGYVDTGSTGSSGGSYCPPSDSSSGGGGGSSSSGGDSSGGGGGGDAGGGC